MNKRIVKVCKNGVWSDSSISQLTKGDRFKLYEPDGTLVGDFIADGEHYKDTCNVYGIKTINKPKPTGLECLDRMLKNIFFHLDHSTNFNETQKQRLKNNYTYDADVIREELNK